MTNPALTIDIDGRNDKAKKSLDELGDAADKVVGEIEGKFEDFDPKLNTENYTKSITSLVVGLGAAGVAAGGLLELVVSLNKSLADTAETAERVGFTIQRFQQVKFAGNALGISDSDLTSGLDAFAKNLQNSQFLVTDIERTFKANGQTLTDNNGKLKDANALFNTAIDLIQRQKTVQDAIQVGGFFGLGQKFAQSLYDAGPAFQSLASQAESLGGVIDEATVRKAEEFSREWTKASALWSASLKGSITGILPLLNEAVSGAIKVIGYVESAYNFISAIKDFAIAPKVDTASISQLKDLIEQYKDIKATLESGKALNPIQLFRGSNIQDENHQITVQSVDKAIADINAEIEKRKKDVKPLPITVTAPAVNPGPQGGGNSRDVFETSVDSLTKRTALVNADTQAIFQNNAARQQLRAEFELLNAILRDNGEVTQDQINKYETLRQSMSAQQALTAAGIALTNEHAEAFLRVSQNIGTATANYDSARDQLNRINSASQQVGSALSSAFADAVVDAKNLNDVLSGLLKTLEKAAINGLFSQFFNPGAGGGLSPVASLFSTFLGVGRNAGGTDNWRGGPTWINENTPNAEIVDLPRGSRVTPSSIAPRSGSSGNVYVYSSPTFTGGLTPTDIAAITAMQQQNNQQLRGQIITDIRGGIRKDADYLRR